MRLVVAAAAASLAVARAAAAGELPRLHFDPPPSLAIARVTLAANGPHATVTLALVADRRGGDDDAPLSIDLPAGTLVRGMATTAARARRVAERRDRERAREDFYRARNDDPGAVELELADVDRVVVRAASLASTGRAVVVLDLELPDLTALAISSSGWIGIVDAPGGRRAAVHAPVAIALATPGRAWFDAASPERAVDAEHALYIGPELGPIPQVTIGCGGIPHRRPYLDKQDIRREIRRHEAAVTYCYTRQAQRDPQLAGAVVLRLAIDETGAVITADAAGLDGTVATCIADEARRWRFHEGDSTVVVSYPYTFRNGGR